MVSSTCALSAQEQANHIKCIHIMLRSCELVGLFYRVQVTKLENEGLHELPNNYRPAMFCLFMLQLKPACIKYPIVTFLFRN